MELLLRGISPVRPHCARQSQGGCLHCRHGYLSLKARESSAELFPAQEQGQGCGPEFLCPILLSPSAPAPAAVGAVHPLTTPPPCLRQLGPSTLHPRSSRLDPLHAISPAPWATQHSSFPAPRIPCTPSSPAPRVPCTLDSLHPGSPAPQAPLHARSPAPRVPWISCTLDPLAPRIPCTPHPLHPRFPGSPALTGHDQQQREPHPQGQQPPPQPRHLHAASPAAPRSRTDPLRSAPPRGSGRGVTQPGPARPHVLRRPPPGRGPAGQRVTRGSPPRRAPAGEREGAAG